MNILETLVQLRDDIKTWVTNNLRALNTKIDEKTIPVDSELSATSVNPVQNKAIVNALAGKQPIGDYALKSEIPTVPVQSVNGKTGVVELTPADIGAQPAGDYALKTEILPSDWNENDPNSPAYVQNRTHWVERPYEPIVWDGSTEGRDSMDLSFMFEAEAGSFIFYKISEMILSPEQIETSFAYATCDGLTYKAQLNTAYEVVPGAAWLSGYAIQDENVIDFAHGQLVSVAIEGDFSDSLGLIIPSSGTYAMMQDPHYVEISADVYHKVDWRYIPDEIASKNDVGIAISPLATREYVDNVAKDNITTNYVEQEIGKAIEGLPTKEYVDAGDEIPTYDMGHFELQYHDNAGIYSCIGPRDGLYELMNSYDFIKFTNVYVPNTTFRFDIVATKYGLVPKNSDSLIFIGIIEGRLFSITFFEAQELTYYVKDIAYQSYVEERLNDSITTITPESIGAQVAGDYALSSSIPTKVSDLTNDAGYLTEHQSLAGYATETYADNSVSTHNTNTSAHNDIRDLISGLSTRLNALADSDDTTLDQMSEIVAYIKANKSLIDSVTTSKVNTADIVDNLTTNVATKPLSAAQGVALKTLIDEFECANSNIVNGSAARSLRTTSAYDNLGAYAFGEGLNTEASGMASHAAGSATVASGDFSYAGGNFTVADRQCMTAIGKSNLGTSGDLWSLETSSFNTMVSINKTYAASSVPPTFSPTEGTFTWPNSSTKPALNCSGSYIYYTATSYVFVQSAKPNTANTNTVQLTGIRYDIIDQRTRPGELLFVVGNGTSSNNRSNAHTLDWSGNAWFSGDVYVGSTSGTNKDEGSKKLATEDFVTAALTALGLPIPTAADAGKILRVNAEGKYELVAIANAEEATF